MDDLPEICRDDPTCYGLLQSVECFCSDEIGNPTKSFNFLHLGIQEYFAAKYVALLPEDEVYTLLKESFLVDKATMLENLLSFKYLKEDDLDFSKSVRLSNMWIMYCGITNGQSESLKRYLLKYEKPQHSPVFDQLPLSPDMEWPLHTLPIAVTLTDVSALPNPYQQQPRLEYHSISQHVANAQVNTENLTTPLKSSDQEMSHTVTINENILQDPVKVLYLFHCFQEAQDDKLCDVLSKSFDSGKIDLSGQKLLPHQVVSVGFFLSRSHKKLKELNMEGCCIGYNGINLLHHYLCGHKTNNQEIITINFSDNGLTGASSSLLIGDLIANIQPQSVILNKNAISVWEISKIIVITNTIKVLHIRDNYLTVQDISPICDMLTCLEELDISNNKLGDDGAVIISERMTKTNTLRVLCISNNRITSTGTAAIANSLLHNSSLEVLYMGYNAIKQKGAVAIAQAIKQTKTLKELSLKGDDTVDDLHIGPVWTIFNSLAYNNSVIKFGLPYRREYQYMDADVKRINDARRKRNVQELSVDYFYR